MSTIHIPRKRRGTSILFRTLTVMLLGIVLVVWGTPALAVDGNPPNLFNLDGTPADPNGVVALPDDWNTLFTECDEFGDCGGIPDEFTGIVADPLKTSIYWKGGSKDVLDISEWWHTSGKVPDKDEILNAFAAAYKNPGDVCFSSLGYDPECDDSGTEIVHYMNDTIIYFGMDRFDNSGDAFAGFWFLQNDIEADEATNRFTDAHVPKTADLPGDVLVLVEYPQGSGEVPLIKVYQWDPDLIADDDGSNSNGDPNLDELGKNIGPLEMIYSSADNSTAPALCDGKGDKLACAISNETDIDASLWPYMSKDDTEYYPHETFYEGGINLTQLLGGKNLCVSSFLAETRSSRSETAQLKDFVLTGFSLCGSEIRTNVHDLDHNDITFAPDLEPGIIVHDWAEVKTSGPGVVEDPEGTVNFYLYDNLTCDGNVIGSDLLVPLVGGTPDDNTATAASKDFGPLAPGDYSFHADFESDNPRDFPSISLDSAECEYFTVGAYQPEIRTEIHEVGGHSPDIQGDTVYVGLTIHDHAYVWAPGFPGAILPTGNVDFKLFATDDCTGEFTTLTGALDGSGEAVTSTDFTPLGDTVLSYSASYAGDVNYLPTTVSDCEPLIVNKFESEIRTEIHKDGGHGPDLQTGSVLVGDSYHDHAYVSEKTGIPTSPPIPTGDVTFQIFEGTSCSPPALTTFGGISWDQIGTLSAGEAVTGTFTPPAATSFGISVSYVGDENYRPATDVVCEWMTVRLWPPRILTKVIVRDLAEVSGDMPGNPPTGSVKFETYRTTDCSGTAVDTVTRPLLSGIAEQELASEQTLTVASDVVSYKATYLGDLYYDFIEHDCELVQFSVLE